jgi:hypothetical protein
MARIQPQGAARLDRRNKFAANAQAILSAAHSLNLATNKPLTVAGTGYLKQGFPAGQALSFRKNFYVETELLPAIGTASFVEYWLGYPSADLYAKGSSSQDPGFLTGSSANMVGICGSIGSRTGGGSNWGAVYNWNSNQINNTGEVLPPGQLALLVVVRRQSGMEFWRNGRLVSFIAQAPVSYPAQTLICGSFVEDSNYWTSSSDTVLAGRVLMPVEPTADEIKQFMANVWQQFLAPHEDQVEATAGPVDMPVLPGAATLTFTGFAPSVVRGVTTSLQPGASMLGVIGYAPSVTQGLTKTISPAPASVTVTGFAPSIDQTAARNTNPGPAALTITGYSPTVARGANLIVAAGAPAALAITGYAPTVTQANNVTPHMYDATIMRLSAVRSVADLGPDRLQQTADLL